MPEWVAYQGPDGMFLVETYEEYWRELRRDAKLGAAVRKQLANTPHHDVSMHLFLRELAYAISEPELLESEAAYHLLNTIADRLEWEEADDAT